jgi:hypothetical protein
MATLLQYLINAAGYVNDPSDKLNSCNLVVIGDVTFATNKNHYKKEHLSFKISIIYQTQKNLQSLTNLIFFFFLQPSV